MIALIEGKIFSFVLLIIMVVVIYLAMEVNMRGTVKSTIRSLPAIDAIPEAVGRCAELGKPCFQTFGYGPEGLKGDQAGQWIAALSILSFVADECVKLDVPMIVIPCAVDAVTVANDIIREAYIAGGKPEGFSLDIVRYVPAEAGNQFTYIQSVLGVMSREKPGANILVGPYYAESIIFGEESFNQGALSISGTANMHQLPFFIVTTDYTLLGEETFAAGALLSDEPAQLGTILGQDISKIISIIVLLIGVFAASAGLESILHLLEM
jgi:hypothetical protein